MKLALFEVRPEETILVRAVPSRKWYAIGWRAVGGLLGIATLAFILFGVFGNPTENGLSSFLPASAAHILTIILYTGLVPLLGLAWLVEDVAAAFIAEFILTDRRLWVRGSPYVWSCSETPLEDIESMAWRRDALFVRNKSSRKIQVHMFREGKQFAEIFKQKIREAS